jgi:hypothetical protein
VEAVADGFPPKTFTKPAPAAGFVIFPFFFVPFPGVYGYGSRHHF